MYIHTSHLWILSQQLEASFLCPETPPITFGQHLLFLQKVVQSHFLLEAPTTTPPLSNGVIYPAPFLPTSCPLCPVLCWVWAVLVMRSRGDVFRRLPSYAREEGQEGTH